MPRKGPLAPLRRIVGRKWEVIPGTSTERIVEVLECGHTQPPKQDIIGQTNAYRRRCRACLKRGRERKE